MADQTEGMRAFMRKSCRLALLQAGLLAAVVIAPVLAGAQVVERADAPPNTPGTAPVPVESIDTIPESGLAPAAAAAAGMPAGEILEPLAIDSQWSPLKFNLKDVVLPTDNEALIGYLSESYDAREAELTIDEAVLIALEHNHALNSKRLDAVAACRGIDINWADLRPQASLQSKAYWIRSDAKAEIEESLITSLAVSLTQRIYDWGLTHRLIDVSRAQFSIQNYTVDMAEQQLVAEVITRYYQFSAALGQARIRRDELKLSLEFLRQAQIQFEVGTVPRLDVIRAEARVEQARDSLISALATIGDAAAAFYSLLGVEDKRYVPAIITADLIELGNAPQPVDVVAQTAINTRPEVELQYTTLFAGQAAVELTKNRPILQAYGNGLLQTPAVTGGKASAEYGVQLLWNFYTGGRDNLERDKAQIELKALTEAVLDLEAKVELDATTSWNRAAAAREAVSSSKKSLELSAEALRAAAVGYGAGVTPYIDFQNALDTNVAAALGYLMALVEVKLSQVNLDRAQGFPAGYPGDNRAGRNGEMSVAELVTGNVAPPAENLELQDAASADAAPDSVASSPEAQ